MGPGRLRPAQGALAALTLAAAVLLQGATSAACNDDASPAPDSVAALRQSADLTDQRRHVWGVVEAVVAGPQPAFAGWAGEGTVFGAPDAAPGLAGFARPAGASVDLHSAGAPVIAFTLYNPAAAAHIRAHGLQRAAGLQALRVAADSSVPAFPKDAVVIKTAWWPVAAHGATALPVWDPELNPPTARGNPYLGWRRVVAVSADRSLGPVSFMGRSFAGARRVDLAAFHHLAVNADLAARLARDPESRRTATIALGRPIAAGDQLALVGLNLMTREQDDWVWAALWWHDRPDAGPFAEGRPAGLRGPWRNYLMQAAFDTTAPRAADGGAHICFNPWLEGRFPDGGQGAGAVSNCMSCHQRASYPAAPFLPVTRGAPDPRTDAALGPDRLRTSFLWSLALHAQP